MKKKFEDIKKELTNKYLFKRDINGKVIYWTADVLNTKDGYHVRSFYGQIHSRFTDDIAKSISEPIQSVNIGKSNETTPQEQAYKRLLSEYNDHLKKGYKSYNIDLSRVIDVYYIDNIVDKTNTGIDSIAQPMKFKSFELGKCKYPMIGQPKYNGVRCIVAKANSNSLFDPFPTSFLSKELVQYHAEHLNQYVHTIINKLENVFPSVVLDGELYIPGQPPTSIAGAARNPSNHLNKKLQFVIYDLAIDNVSQLNRIGLLKEYTNSLDNPLLKLHSNAYTNPFIYLSEYKIIHSDEEAIEYLDKCLNLGYEGCVLRPFDKEYAFGQRPSFNRKLKRFQDSEFEILDIIEYGTRGQKVGFGCKFICRNDIDGGTFESIPLGDYDKRIEYIDNKEKYIGKLAKVKFYERTINSLPFHGNVLEIREIGD